MVQSPFGNREALELMAELIHGVRSQDRRKRNKHLTDRELTVLSLVLEGRSYSQIAEKLSIEFEKVYDNNSIKSLMYKVIAELRAAFRTAGLSDDINKRNLKSSLARYRSNCQVQLAIDRQNPTQSPCALDDVSRATIARHLESWGTSGYVYSAPSAIFFCGEHAVVYGHPAIYFPLPMRLFVHVEADRSREGIVMDEFITRNPSTGQIQNVKHVDDYGRKLATNHEDNLNVLYRSAIGKFLSPFQGTTRYGFRLKIISEFPIACGLDSSGAIAAAFASILANHFLDIEKFIEHYRLSSEQNASNPIAYFTKIIAWAIENCFHNHRSSGIGALAALHGRVGRHPLVYVTSKRSQLPYRLAAGWQPVDVDPGESAIHQLSNIKTILFDPAARTNDRLSFPPPPAFNLSSIYCGNISRTEQMLTDRSLCRYSVLDWDTKSYLDGQLTTLLSPDEIQRSVHVHSHEITQQIQLNSQISPPEKSNQMDIANRELMAEALGIISTSAIESILTDWQALPSLMNTYQSLLFTYGASDMRTDALMMKLALAALEYQIHQGRGKPAMGIKVTGSGGGGDFIAFSLLPAAIHQKLLQTHLDSTSGLHFDSTLLPTETWERPVEGARREH